MRFTAVKIFGLLTLLSMPNASAFGQDECETKIAKGTIKDRSGVKIEGNITSKEDYIDVRTTMFGMRENICFSDIQSIKFISYEGILGSIRPRYPTHISYVELTIRGERPKRMYLHEPQAQPFSYSISYRSTLTGENKHKSMRFGSYYNNSFFIKELQLDG